MKMKKALSLLLAITLVFSVMAFSPAVPEAVAEKDVLRILPSDDSFISFQDGKESVAHGDETKLEIGYSSTDLLFDDPGFTGNASKCELLYARNIMLKFDLGEVDTSTVKSAVLKLTTEQKLKNSNDIYSTSIVAYDCDSSWDEATVTAENAPAEENVAAVSNVITKDNSSPGSVVEIDLTDYIRTNPNETYSFRLKVSASGLDFHSKESGTSSARPVLEIETDNSLSSSKHGKLSLSDDTFAHGGEADKSHGSETFLCVASTSGSKPAGNIRNSFIKFTLPEGELHYDKVSFVIRGKSVDNADNTVSLVPTDADWSEDTLTFSSSPDISAEAAASFTVKNDNTDVNLRYYTVDLTDYVNNHLSPDGIYSFALVSDTAIDYFYSSNHENPLYRPYVEYICREKASLTLRYTDSDFNDIASEKTLSLPVGDCFTPEDFPSVVGEYYYSSQKTAQKNPFPYVVQKGENTVYLVYEDKSIAGTEEINVTCVQYEKPVLPDKILVKFDKGTDEYFNVAWSEISAESYTTPGEFTVMGTLTGIQADAVFATVKVLGITGVIVPTVSTAPGSFPALPDQLEVNLDDGSTHYMDVTWNEVDSSEYAQVGSFVVGGTLTLSGMPVQLNVLVEEGDINDRVAVADAYTQYSEPNKPHNTEDLRISAASGSGAAATDRKTFLRFEGGNFGEVYHDSERDADIDPIVSSKIRLYVSSIGNNATVTYKVYGINPENDSWDETSVTWNSSESDVLGAEYISSLSVKQSTFTESYLEFDVTRFVRNNRQQKYLSFYIEANTCATVAVSKEGDAQKAPTLRTVGYIPDAPVTLRSVAQIGGETVDIAPRVELKGKLEHPYEYLSAIANPIYYPEADPDGIYYYDFVTKPIPPAEGEKDPDLSLDSLNADENQILVKYVRREITRTDAVDAQTYRGVKPSLPETVTAYLDNDTPVTENVTWRWDEVDFRSYSTKGTFTLYGDIEHSATVRAEAKIEVCEAYYGESFSQTNNEFDIEPATDYVLSFTIHNTDSIPDYIGEFYIQSAGKYYNAVDMDSASLAKYFSEFNDGDTVDVFFTSPDIETSMTLTLPDCITYITSPTLRPVLGRGGDMTLHYMFNNEEIYTSGINVAFGEEFSLSEEYFTILDGAYIVTGLDGAVSDMQNLTDSIIMDTDGLNAYLICSYAPVFTVSTYLENVLDGMFMPYARSVATLFNGTDTPKDAMVVVAKYTNDGVLVSVETEKITVKEKSPASVTVVKNVPLDDDGYSTIMLWDEISGLTPYLSKVDSRNPSGEVKKPTSGDYILIPALSRYVSASEQQSGNEAVNMLNRELSSRWSAQVTSGDPVWADIDLGGVYDIHTIGLGFYNGKTRSSRFSVEVSDDGENFVEVISPRYSSGKTNSAEYYTFPTVTASHVRVKGYGWKANEITNEGLVEKFGDWFSVTAFEAYGPMNDISGITVGETMDFEGANGIKIGDDEAEGTLNWGSAALSEMNYTDYTPAKGGSLYADFAQTPVKAGMGENNTALHIYDNVDRDGEDGAGSIGVFHKMEIPSEKYRIKFKWFVPNTIEDSTYNAQWSGLALSAGKVRGGSDTSHPVAFQMRLSPSGKNKMSFNLMRSITYNEGSQVSLLGSGSSFKANCVWDVSLDVDSKANTVIVTVSDGVKTESQMVRYGLYNSERTITQTWNNSSVNYIMFNSGAGGKCEMYIDDFSVVSFADDSEDSGNVIFSEDFSDYNSGDKIRTGEGVASALIKETNQEYTASYGTMLDVSIASPSALGSKALRLYDFVGREEDSVKGAGGVFAYIDLPDFSTQNITKLKFDMYAPNCGEYGGFALANGRNEGGDDTTNRLALQARFSPQSEGMQINMNNSSLYNKGSYSAMVGTGSNRLGYGKIWTFEISVNPTIKNITVKATDGSSTSTKTVSMPDTSKVDWSKTPINTLIINTGAGTTGDIYIDNITVTDTGISKNSLAAVNGVIRLENEYAGNGYYVVHANKVGSKLGVASGQNPYYTRIVERRGLADPDSVSFELLGQPGCYVVADSDWNVTVQKYRDTDSFRTNATFNKVNNVCGAGNTAFSYQLYRNKNLYLRLNGSYITVHNLSQQSSDGIRKACTFHLRNEANNYVSDSFDGNSLSSQWYKGYPWYSNYHNHSAVHRDSNVVVNGGKVLLKATKRGSNEWIKNSAGATGYSDSINGGTWKRYVAWTGVISVNNKVYNKGSYIEGSFKQPNSPVGYWTAFWLNGRDSWPPETDMFEYLSSKGTSTWYTATHGGSEGAGWQTNSAVGNLRTQYHTFAIDWGYNYMKMYVNGSLYFTAPDTSAQKNMYLILNTGIGAWETEPNSSTVWNTGMECEYIRSYQYY